MKSRRVPIFPVAEFFWRAFPILDVRLVPNLPKPRFDFGIAVTCSEVKDELKDKLRPLLIVLRRVRPARVDGTLWKTVPVRIGVSGKCFRHEADFHERLDARHMKSVKNAVQNCPIIDGIPGSVFRVNVGRAPFERSGAVSGGQQIMSAYVDWLGAKGAQLAEKSLPVGSVGIVRLIVAKIVPDGRKGSIGSIGEHLNLHTPRSLLCPARCASQKRQHDEQK